MRPNLREMKHSLHALLSQAVTVDEMQAAGMSVRDEREHLDREVRAIVREIDRARNLGRSL